MLKIVLVVAVLGLCSIQARSQVSKQVDERTKDAESAQKKSWQQVDEINNQTDQTNSRLRQSRQDAAENLNQARTATITKTRMGVASPYRKGKPKKLTHSLKQNQH